MIEPTKNNTSPSLRKSMITGSIWMVTMRWSIRGIGLISTIILARLLVPEDFGIVAMSMIVVGLIEALSGFGVEMALIRNTSAERKHYDTAWTFRLLQALIVSSLLIMSAPVMAGYFEEPRVVAVIQLLALGIIIGGFENIGVVAFRKELDFGKEFRFKVLKKILTFITTISFALVLKNYWALVIGIIMGRVLEVILSYLMHHYRPRLCLKAARELWSFSQWMLLINLGAYANQKLDEIVVGGTSSTSNMGSYSIATEVATLPTSEIVMPLSRALFPGYSMLVGEPERLSAAFKNVLSFVFFVTLPAAFGVGIVAEDLVLVVLGEKWVSAIPLIKWLAILGASAAISSMTYNLLIAMARERLLTILHWITLAVSTPLLFFAAEYAGIEGIAAVRAGISILFTIVLFSVLSNVINISYRMIVGLFWRPFFASLVMLFAVMQTHSGAIASPIITLVLDVGTGSVVFVITAYFLWYISGRKPGAEKMAVEFLLRHK